MEMPKETQDLIKEALEIVRTSENHNLPPLMRIKIYASFGPSFGPVKYHLTDESSEEEAKIHELVYGEDLDIDEKEEEIYEPTLADLVRSWVTILSARKLVPIWKDVLIDADLLRYSLNMLQSGVPMDKQPNDATARDTSFPEYLLEFAEKLINGLITPQEILPIIDWAEWFVGENFFDSKERYIYPAEAYYANHAALHALLETMYYNVYDQTEIDESDITFADNNEAIPASAAIISYAGIFLRNNEWGGYLNPNLSLEFWEWWLTEAIPQVWQLAQEPFCV